MNFNWQQLVPLLVLAVFSIGGFVLRTLAEQAEKKKRLEAEERRRMDEIRTGGVSPGSTDASPAPARTRLEEIALRRQAELEALRRRAAQRGASSPVPVAVPTAQQGASRASTGPLSMQQPPTVSDDQRRATDAAARARSDALRAEAERAKRASDAKARREALEKSKKDAARVAALSAPRDSRSSDEGESDTQRRVYDLPPSPIDTPPGRRTRPVGLSARTSAADWRRAIVLREILGDPVCLRAPGSGPGETTS
jgi:hypothetical protein